MVALTIFGIFMVLLFLGVPVVVALAAGTLAGFWQIGLADNLRLLYTFPLNILEGINAPALMAVPFFILAGHLMTAIGLTDRISFALTDHIGPTSSGRKLPMVFPAGVVVGSQCF